MDTQANPVVGNVIAQELAAPDAEEIILPPQEDAEPAEPIAEDEQPIDRRSRRAGKKDAEKIDLSQSEEFRAWQAEQDRKLEAERQQRFRLERQMQEQRQREVHDRLGFLQQQIQEADDPEERARALAEAMALSNETYVSQLNAWNEWKAGQIKASGLNPDDARFSKTYSPGKAGLAEFQADLREAENEKLRRELTEARKAADPASLADLVRKEVARLAKVQGLDVVDLGEPTGAVDDEAWEKDLARFQNGTMSPQEYTKKWGSR